MNTKHFITCNLIATLTIFLCGSMVSQSSHQTINIELNKDQNQNINGERFPTNSLTVYNPPFRFLLPKEVEETSGLAFFNGKLWTINDSGGLPVVYGLDTLTGSIVQHIFVSNATNNDWESLAQDEHYLYIGDFGNNSGKRDDLIIYKIAFSDFPATGDDSLNAEQIHFTYDDYKNKVSNRKENNFDCEAFLAHGDSLYLFSKNWQNQECKLYALPKVAGHHKTHKKATFDTRGMITGADINEATGEVILTGYTDKTWVPFLWSLSDYNGNHFFSGVTQRIDLINLSATQIESIVFTGPEKGIITSEGHILFSQTAFNINTKKWSTFKNDQIINSQPFNFELTPNPCKGKSVYLEFDPIFDSEYSIQIIDKQNRRIKLKKQPVIMKNGNINRIKLKISHLKPGVYTIRVNSGTRNVDKKLIIK